MENQSIYQSEALLPLNTMLANGEILFVCNDREQENWIHARGFYCYHDEFYVVAKDFFGLIRGGAIYSDSFVACAAYRVNTQGTVINSRGKLIATCRDRRWTFTPPGTTLSSQFSRNVQSDQNVDDTSCKCREDSDSNNIQQPQRLTANNFYQWIRRIFSKKRPSKRRISCSL